MITFALILLPFVRDQAPDAGQNSAKVEITTIQLVRRANEPSVRPTIGGKPMDLAVITRRAREHGYFERQEDTVLYMYSPAVLPIALWRQEEEAIAGLVAKVEKDGTVRLTPDSAETRFVRSGTTERYAGEVTLRAMPSVWTTFQSNGRSLRFNMNTPTKRRPEIPSTRLDDSEQRGRSVPVQSAINTLADPDYVLEPAGKAMFLTADEMTRRATAFRLLQEESAKGLKAQQERESRLYAALASTCLDEGKIPRTGESYSNLSTGVQDDVLAQIRGNLKEYGFEDEGSAIKWLAGAKVGRTESWVGLGLNTKEGLTARMLAHRFY